MYGGGVPPRPAGYITRCHGLGPQAACDHLVAGLGPAQTGLDGCRIVICLLAPFGAKSTGDLQIIRIPLLDAGGDLSSPLGGLIRQQFLPIAGLIAQIAHHAPLGLPPPLGVEPQALIAQKFIDQAVIDTGGLLCDLAFHFVMQGGGGDLGADIGGVGQTLQNRGGHRAHAAQLSRARARLKSAL